MMIPKMEAIRRIVDPGLVAVVRAEAAEHAEAIVEACFQGGVTAAEITLTVPGAVRLIETLCGKYRPEDLVIGAGTVLDSETARIALLAGARFIVSPALHLSTARLCNRYQVPYLPGAGTAGEVLSAMEAGAEIVKVFPCETLGPSFISALRGPLPQASFMPTGGVRIDNTASWISAGACAVGVGSQLTAGARTGEFRAITDLARRFIEEIRGARA